MQTGKLRSRSRSSSQDEGQNSLGQDAKKELPCGSGQSSSLQLANSLEHARRRVLKSLQDRSSLYYFRGVAGL